MKLYAVLSAKGKRQASFFSPYSSVPRSTTIATVK